MQPVKGSSTVTNAYARMVAAARQKAAAPAAAAQRPATRADVDPISFNMGMMSSTLGLSEAQRNKLRPVLSAEEKQFSLIKGSKWSDGSKRRRALWQVRDDTARQVARVLDAKQAEKFKAALGPAK